MRKSKQIVMQARALLAFAQSRTNESPGDWPVLGSRSARCDVRLAADSLCCHQTRGSASWACPGPWACQPLCTPPGKTGTETPAAPLTRQNSARALNPVFFAFDTFYAHQPQRQMSDCTQIIECVSALSACSITTPTTGLEDHCEKLNPLQKRIWHTISCIEMHGIAAHQNHTAFVCTCDAEYALKTLEAIQDFMQLSEAVCHGQIWNDDKDEDRCGGVHLGPWVYCRLVLRGHYMSTDNPLRCRDCNATTRHMIGKREK